MKKCPGCSGDVKLYCQNEMHQIYKCINCGLGFTQNLNEQTGDYHRDEVYTQNTQQFKNIFNKRVRIIKKFTIKQGRILEIGSSTGLLLSIFQKQGWKVLGIEISQKAAEFAREKGIPILLTSFESVKLPKNSFDVIILNHTLEHLKDPEKVLKKVKALLSREGILFIDVPNFGGLSAQIFGKDWPYLLPQEHLWHFTLQSIKYFLTITNFKIVYSERSSGIWDYQNPYSEIWQAFWGFKKRFFADLLTAIPAFIISKINLGSGLIVVAKKD